MAALTAVRLMVAGGTGLSPDEAYYWMWSRTLQAGYVDHPFMVALWVRLGTLIGGQTALGVRLLGPLAAMAGSWLLARAARDLGHDGRKAALLLNATLLMGVGAVTMTPDTPLIFFWTLGLFAMARLIATGQAKWWLLAGIAVGLALDSKYTALLFPLSVTLWMVTTQTGRGWLRRPAPYAAAILSALLFAPVLWWNARHGWASFLKQGGRSADWHPARAAQFMAELMAGQIGLATPIIFVLMVAGTVAVCRRWRRDPGSALLACLILLPAAVFIQHAIGDRVQGNWPCVLYPAASIAATVSTRPWLRRATLSGLMLTGLVYGQAMFAPLALPGRLDVTLIQLAGWREWAEQAEHARRQAKAVFIASDDYGLASELAFALPGPVPVVGTDPRWEWLARPHADITDPRQGILIRKARGAETADLARYGRNGAIAERYHIVPVTISDLSKASLLH